MIRRLTFLAVLAFSTDTLSSPEDQRFFGTTPVTIYVDPISGSDANSHCGDSAATACLTPLAAYRQLPAGWTALVSIEIGAGATTLPTTYFSTVSGAYTDTGVIKEGMVAFRAACASPLATWSGALSGSAVTGRFSQKNFSVSGGWSGTVSDGTHYVRFPTTASPGVFYATTRASTSPTLKLVTESTSISDGKLCAYETVVTNTDTARLAGNLSPARNPIVSFSGLKFTTKVEFYNVRLDGVSAALTTSPPILTNVNVRGLYVAYAATTYSTGDALLPPAYVGALWAGCPQFRGHFLTVGGVVTGSCAINSGGGTTQGQLSVGVFDDHVAVFGLNEIRNFSSLDFEGTGRCIRAFATTMRLGTSATGISCNTSDGEALWLDHQSTFSFNPGAQFTGSTTKRSIVDNGSFLGPMGGGWAVVNTSDGGDFDVGTITGVRVGPDADGGVFVRVSDGTDQHAQFSSIFN